VAVPEHPTIDQADTHRVTVGATVSAYRQGRRIGRSLHPVNPAATLAGVAARRGLVVDEMLGAFLDGIRDEIREGAWPPR
jgi:hypothetical protein